jgi:hypothetical protein
MRKLLLLLSLVLAVTSTAVFAGDSSGTTNVTQYTANNTTGLQQSDIAIALPLFTQSLIDGNFLATDSQNSTIHTGINFGNDSVYMPATGNIQVLAAYNNAGGNETTAAHNSTENDLTLPTALNENYEFALDHQARTVELDIDTPTDANWTVTWQYYDGSSWTAFSNVEDRTIGFTVLGPNNVQWDIPADWTRQTLHATAGFWLRARVTAVAVAPTTNPLGTQAWYETGRWWIYEQLIDVNQQELYNIYTGGVDLTTTFKYFPGSDGLITPDDATLEIGNDFNIKINGVFNAESGSNKDIILKTDSVRAYISATDQLTVEILNTGSTIANFYSTTANDDFLQESDPVYATAHADTTADSQFSTDIWVGHDTGYVIYRAPIRFDTGSLPNDATITSARLRLHGTGSATTDDFNLQIQSYSGGFPIATDDYNQSKYSGNYGTLNTSGWTLSAYNDITFSDTSVINLTGNTDLGIRNDNEIAATAPSNKEIVVYENTNEPGTSEDPLLEVTYEVKTTLGPVALVSGYHTIEIDGDGAGNCSLIIDTVTVDTDASCVSAADNANNWNFLTNGSTVYIDRMEIETGGTAQQLEYELTAQPTAQFLDTGSAGNNNDTSYMSFPTEIAGLIISSGPTISTTVQSTSSSEQSSSGAVDTVGTLSNLTGGETGSNLPLFSFFSEMATLSDIPVSIYWIVIAMVTSIFAGVLTFYAFKSVMASYIMILVCLVGWTTVGSGVLPWFMVFVFGFGGAIFVFYRRAAI